MKRLAFLLAVAALAVPVLVHSQADDATISKIVDEGKNHNQVMDHLKHLTKKIGPRLTGSPELQKACDWTASMFKKFGCQNVHLEQWGEVPVGFERGKHQIGRMVEPDQVGFEFTTPAWTPGTKGLVRGEAILEPTTMADFEKVKSKIKGAWIVTKRGGGGGGRPGGGGSGAGNRPPGAPAGGPPVGGAPAGGGGGGQAPQVPDEQRAVLDAIAKEGPAGTVSGSRNDLVVTGGRYTGLTWDNLPNETRVTIRKKDFDQVVGDLDQGKKVVLEFNLEQHFIKGPVPVYNVIAEIPGTEHPEEVVIVSGHLDSWNGPGSEGALDNGTGTMVALEAARILTKVGAKPKRTIRFILWSGEEQGLFGSKAYVEKHKDEMSKISCVFVDDGGTNYEGGVTCTKDMEPLIKMALEPAKQAFPDMPIEIRIAERIPRGGGSDHASFNAVGVPGFFWFETGRSDYNFVHHTQHDRYELAIPEYLVQSSTNAAAASYIMACAPTLLPREQAAPTTTPPPGGNGSR